MSDVIVIEPGRYERNCWRDLWRYRELFRVLAWRELAVRYKQTVLGVAWLSPWPRISRRKSWSWMKYWLPAIQNFKENVSVRWTKSLDKRAGRSCS